MSLARSMRREFGAHSGNIVVRRRAPWYWRFATLLVALALLAAAASWVFHRGKAAGRIESAAEVSQLTLDLQEQIETIDGLQALRVENQRLRAELTGAENQAKLGASAQSNLGKSLADLQQENARLKEDLGFLRQATSADPREALSISNFKVERDNFPNQYRYRALLVQATGREREFHGKAELLVSVERAGRPSVEAFAQDGAPKSGGFAIAFKHYHRLEGTFQLSDGAVVKNVQLRVYEQGASEPKLMRTASLVS
jgi:hypothetical protein